MKTRWLLAVCLLASTSQAQETKRELWMWKDANGVVHYSDVPAPGARKVDLAVSVPPSKTAPVATQSPATTGAAAPAAAAATGYDTLEIWQPENGASFFGADAVVNVRMRSEPDVGPDDTLLLYLDGQLVEGERNAVEYSLAELERGVHSLTASIRDRKGNEKIRSQPVVFHIKQPTTIAPAAVGPNLKPPPPPQPKPAPKPGPKSG
jgi:hypothetical protein